MRRCALALGLAGALACGCLFGSRPQLPDEEDGGLGGTVGLSDASDPTRNHDAAAMPPYPSVDAAVDARPRDVVVDAARDAAADGRCADDDAGDAGDAPDAGDAHDGAHPCQDGGARPALGMEVHP